MADTQEVVVSETTETKATKKVAKKLTPEEKEARRSNMENKAMRTCNSILKTSDDETRAILVDSLPCKIRRATINAAVESGKFTSEQVALLETLGIITDGSGFGAVGIGRWRLKGADLVRSELDVVTETLKALEANVDFAKVLETIEEKTGYHLTYSFRKPVEKDNDGE